MNTNEGTLERRRLGRTEYDVTRLDLGTFRITIDFVLTNADVREEQADVLIRVGTVTLRSSTRPPMYAIFSGS
jgi:hypothetical protein